MDLIINDLNSSNFLAGFFTSGGLLQTGPDQFILLLGDIKPVFSAASADAQQVFVYNPQFWDFLQTEPGQIQGLYQVGKTLSVTRQQLIDFFEKTIVKHSTELEFVDAHKNDFEKQFFWSQKMFAQKKLQKTVPATKFEYRLKNKFNFAFQLYLSLQKIRSGYIYGMWNSSSGFMGLTPELLAAWDGESLSTMALAGTWSHEKKFAQVSDVDLKTQDEHGFVVNDIRERLGQILVGETHILNLPTLSHLKTSIQKSCVSLSDFIEAVVKLHPTAALGIYPRKIELAREFAQLPVQNERGFFGAPFGIINAQSGQVVVGIRGLIWDEKHLNIFVGCGVTAQSEFSLEWQELQTKKNAICEAFSLQNC